MFLKEDKILDTQLKKKKYRLPTVNQWLQLPKILSKKEKYFLIFFLSLFIGSLSFLSISFYQDNTQMCPAHGGIYREGVVGQPRFINPIYAASNDVDKDLTGLIFSGLMKYNSNGEIIPDIAKEPPTIKEDGTIYEVYLRDDVFFHDMKKLTADDIVFTVNTIQNPDFKSPIRANWLGVKIEKISDEAVRFRLENPYPDFLETLTLKILPAHIWKNISAQQFALSPYNNLQPIGSGPYKIKTVDQDKKSGKILSINLEAFSEYHQNVPYISQVSFIFFEKKENLINAAKKGSIDALSSDTPISAFNQYSFYLPRYFAVFFNESKNKLLAQKEIRQALNYATNKKEIIEKVLLGEGKQVDSPLLPEIYGYNPPKKIYEFDIEKAESLFEKAGFTKEDGLFVKTTEGEKLHFTRVLEYGDRGKEVEKLQQCLSLDTEIYPEKKVTGYFGKSTKKGVIAFQEKYAKDILEPIGLTKGTGDVRRKTIEKLNEVCIITPAKTIPLKIILTTVEDTTLKLTANVLKEQWEKAGIKVEIETLPISALKQDVIRPRNYEALLFGEVLGTLPDPFPFWHSSQKTDPGLNIAEYKNKNVDKLIEQARIETDTKIKSDKYEEIQELIIEDSPAVFLYNPNYLYFASNKIKGIKAGLIADPSQRFSAIEDWYITTKRAFK